MPILFAEASAILCDYITNHQLLKANLPFILNSMPVSCPKPSNSEIALIADKLRESVVEMLAEAGSGHTAGALGSADILATL
jgi:hypothetical protein